jgi:hypothetical protein
MSIGNAAAPMRTNVCPAASTSPGGHRVVSRAAREPSGGLAGEGGMIGPARRTQGGPASGDRLSEEPPWLAFPPGGRTGWLRVVVGLATPHACLPAPLTPLGLPPDGPPSGPGTPFAADSPIGREPQAGGRIRWPSRTSRRGSACILGAGAPRRGGRPRREGQHGRSPGPHAPLDE